MGNLKVKLNSRRIFSEDFKKLRVKEYESGKFTLAELSRLHGVSLGIVYRWVHKYSTYNKKSCKIVEMDESSTKKVKEMENRIKELERIVGQKQLKIDFLEKMIEIADEDFNIDIKKKSNTKLSGGSEKTDVK